MNSGKLNRRIVIQSRTVTKDTAGGRVEIWADSATVWAELVTQRGTVANIADADRNQDTSRFRIRYRAINTSDNRILYKLRFYDIKGITEEGIKNTLLLDTVATQSSI